MIDADFLDSYANPGDLVTLFGENLYEDIIIIIAGIEIIPSSYSTDSSSLDFICPLLPQGDYDIYLRRDGLRFSAGEITIFCDPIETNILGIRCFNLGDTVACSWANDDSPMYYPFFAADSGEYSIVIIARDLFRNLGADTTDICFRRDTIFMESYAFADSCDADTIFFRIRHDNPIDETTISIMFAGEVHTFGDDEVRWLDDSTLVFITPAWVLDSLRGLYPVSLSDIIRDIDGHSLLPDDGEETLSASFRIPCCNDLYAFLYCPVDSFSFISCDPFLAEFIIMDTSSMDMPDTSEIFISMKINTIDIEPDYMISGFADSISVSISPFWSENDSVWIVLDSVFSINGCKTVP
ncbi:MAG: hypothetical protein ACLFSQ_04635 [Candidatus Zixiibacteriota bacterium]